MLKPNKMHNRIYYFGDLVEINHGNKPLGMVVGPRQVNMFTNVSTYPIDLFGTEEIIKYPRWYHSGGIEIHSYDYMTNTTTTTQRKLLPVYIGPFYLKFLSNGN